MGKDVVALLSAAKRNGVSSGVLDNIKDCIAGKITTVPLPWPMLDRKVNALLPSTITVVIGDPDTNKSFWLLQSAAHWLREGVDFSLLMLEDGRDYHLKRALAQKAKMPNLSFPDWIKNHPEEAEEAYHQHQDWLDRFGKRIHTAEEHVTIDEIAGWVGEQAEAGRRVIVVDPITAAMPDREVWISQHKFIMRVKKTIEKSKSSLIVISHPKRRGAKEGVTMDLVANGSAWARFTQTILWLGRKPDGNLETVRNKGGDDSAEVNRYFKVLKCRNGPAAGWNIGYLFMEDSLTLVEQGVIIK
jgi:KaiC/GvpD/RAD55 family RecA-like ATPase